MSRLEIEERVAFRAYAEKCSCDMCAKTRELFGEIDGLRSALERIRDNPTEDSTGLRSPGLWADWAKRVAREALEAVDGRNEWPGFI